MEGFQIKLPSKKRAYLDVREVQGEGAPGSARKAYSFVKPSEYNFI
jgi:hypothetical protein